MTKLSDKQKKTLQYITEFIDINGYSPSVSELCEHFGIYIHAADRRVQTLISKGFITKIKGKHRTISIVKG